MIGTVWMLMDDMVRMMNFLSELFATKQTLKWLDFKMNHEVISGV